MFPWMSHSRITALERTSTAAAVSVSNFAAASAAVSQTSPTAEQRWAFCASVLEATVPMKLNDSRRSTARRHSAKATPLAAIPKSLDAPKAQFEKELAPWKPRVTSILLAMLPLELQNTKLHRSCLQKCSA